MDLLLSNWKERKKRERERDSTLTVWSGRKLVVLGGRAGVLERRLWRWLRGGAGACNDVAILWFPLIKKKKKKSWPFFTIYNNFFHCYIIYIIGLRYWLYCGPCGDVSELVLFWVDWFEPVGLELVSTFLYSQAFIFLGWWFR